MRTNILTGLKGSKKTTSIIEDDNGNIKVMYQETEVFKFEPFGISTKSNRQGIITLNTGGWLTFMTSVKMQQALNHFGFNNYSFHIWVNARSLKTDNTYLLFSVPNYLIKTPFKKKMVYDTRGYIKEWE